MVYHLITGEKQNILDSWEGHQSGFPNRNSNSEMSSKNFKIWLPLSLIINDQFWQSRLSPSCCKALICLLAVSHQVKDWERDSHMLDFSQPDTSSCAFHLWVRWKASLYNFYFVVQRYSLLAGTSVCSLGTSCSVPAASILQCGLHYKSLVRACHPAASPPPVNTEAVLTTGVKYFQCSAHIWWSLNSVPSEVDHNILNSVLLEINYRYLELYTQSVKKITDISWTLYSVSSEKINRNIY